MKYFTTTAFTLLFMVFTVSIFANSNAKTYKGSVTLENGQTLEGQIQMLSPTLNEIKVKFIASNGQATTYKAKEVASYNFTFSKYDSKTKSYKNETVEYVKKNVTVAPVPFGPKAVLVERQVAGTVSLYNFYAETRAAAHAFTHNFFVEKDGQMISVTRENFKSVVKDMVADYPALSAKVGKKGYGFKYIANIITEYNNHVSPKGEMFGMN